MSVNDLMCHTCGILMPCDCDECIFTGHLHNDDGVYWSLDGFIAYTEGDDEYQWPIEPGDYLDEELYEFLIDIQVVPTDHFKYVYHDYDGYLEDGEHRYYYDPDGAYDTDGDVPSSFLGDN